MLKETRIKIADLERVNQYEELRDNDLSLIYGGKKPNWGKILGVALLIVTVGLVIHDNLQEPN